MRHGLLRAAIAVGSLLLLAAAVLSRPAASHRFRPAAAAQPAHRPAIPPPVAATQPREGDGVRDRLLALPDAELAALVDSPAWGEWVNRCLAEAPSDADGHAAFVGPINERIHRLKSR